MFLYVWRYIVEKPYTEYINTEPRIVQEMVIDKFNSLVWCEREKSPGDFRLVLPASQRMLEYFTQNEVIIISRPDTKRAMIVERVELETSKKGDDIIRLSGKSAEGFTGYRVIQKKQPVNNKNVVEIINYYMDECISSRWYYDSDAEHPHRNTNQMYNYVNILRHGEDDNRIMQSTSADAYGMNLSDFISQMCAAFNFGFKIELEGDKLYYSCYRGLDRTINQADRPPVIFSSDFDNLQKIEYVFDKTTKCSHAIAAGSGTGTARISSDSYSGREYVGLKVREKFISSSGSSLEALHIIANNAIVSSNITKTLEGVADSGRSYRYREHYNLGDIVTVRSRYGIIGSATVSEVAESFDASGVKTIPSFSNWTN